MSKDILVIIIATLATTVGWIVFSLHHASQETTIPEEVRELIAPLDPNLNLEALTLLEERKSLYE